MRQLLRRKEMSIPASGERKPMVVLTSPAVFVFWLHRSVSPTVVPLLFCFYIIVRPSFVFYSPKFPTVFSPFSFLLFLTLFLSLYFCCLLAFFLLQCSTSSGFYSQRMQVFYLCCCKDGVTVDVHHGSRETCPLDWSKSRLHRCKLLSASSRNVF